MRNADCGLRNDRTAMPRKTRRAFDRMHRMDRISECGLRNEESRKAGKQGGSYITDGHGPCFEDPSSPSYDAASDSPLTF